MHRQLGHIIGTDGRLGRAAGEAFYEVRLPVEAVDDVEGLLAGVAGHRSEVVILATAEDPSRLVLSEVAAARYLRGSVLRVDGETGKSCEINLSSRFALPVLISQLRDVRCVAHAYVILRVRDRGGDLLEIVPDVEQFDPAAELGVAGSLLAESVWPAEDFSDWD